ncbi:MAG: hypothetical protein IJX16_05905, partial [Clostridia bacterium]|nr:hypothetical protein [Clostridia bacterium]
MSKKLKIFIFVFLDVLIAVASIFTAVGIVEYNYVKTLQDNWYYFLALVGFAIICNATFRLYTGVWRFAGISVMVKIAASCFCMGIASMAIAVFSPILGYAWAIIAVFTFFMLVSLSRFAYRMYTAIESRYIRKHAFNNAERVMIIGAGRAGEALVREMKTTEKINMRPVCFLDDNKNKIGQNMNGVPIVGKTNEVVSCVEKYKIDKIIIAMPSAEKKTV